MISTVIAVIARSLQLFSLVLFFFFNDTATTEIYTLSLHDALPILLLMPTLNFLPVWFALSLLRFRLRLKAKDRKSGSAGMPRPTSYAVFCLKKKNELSPYVIEGRTPESARLPESVDEVAVVSGLPADAA